MDTRPITGHTIAEAAAVTGLSVDTLRYYERDGLLLSEPERTPSGHRRYGDGDLQWIHLLTCLRGTGMPIREIRRYAALVRTGDGTEAERLAMLREHRLAVLARLAETTEHLGAIDRKIGIYLDRIADGS